MKTIIKKKQAVTKMSVGFEGQPHELPEINAYVFDKKGRLLEQKPLKDGSFSLDTAANEIQFHNLLIAPARAEDQKAAPAIETIYHRNAYAPVVKLSDRGLYELLPIPEYNWLDWCFDLCRVNGRVLKPITADGNTYNQPICGAKVHICEVDRISIIIDRIPDYVIFNLRDELIGLPDIDHLIAKRPPELINPDRFEIGFKDRIGPRVGSRDVSSFGSSIGASITSGIGISSTADIQKISNMMASAIRLENKHKITSPQQRISAETIAHMAMMAKSPDKAMLEAVKLPETTRHQLAAAANANQVRSLMVSNIGLLYPYLCLAYWYWPYLYRCDELREVETDAQGRFGADIWFQCFSDKPDLYFWVEYPIGGVDTVVYNPPIACYTYWDYDCSTEVIIKITDSRVEGCDEIPTVIGRRVDVRKIGSGAFVSAIQQNPATVNIQGSTIQTEGTISANIDSSNNFPKPFGGTLGMRVDFGTALISSGITHYRWSYRRVVESGTPDDWKILDTEVNRRYIEETGTTNKHVPYPLGPDPTVSEILFKIPTTSAEDLPIANPSNFKRYWMAEEFNTGVLNTLFGGHDNHLNSNDATVVDAEKAKRLVDAGLYELKFELFEDVASGTPKKVVMPRADWLMPADLNPNSADSVQADDDYLILAPGDMASGFKMKVLVDNNPVAAGIKDVEVDGRTSDTDCGFVAYDNRAVSAADLSFLADHPNKWATFSFQTFRGNNNMQSEASASGMAVGATNGFSQDSLGYFEKSVSIADLLDTCPHAAALAERLSVYALATNGSRRLNQLDRTATAAFAIEPFDVVD